MSVQKIHRPFSLLLGALLLVLGACNDPEPTPAYILVEDVSLSTTPGQGAATEDIKDIWVFIDDLFLGVYDLPARIPVLAEGTTEVRFEFGVRENGITRLPNIYEFYAPVEEIIDVVPGETYDMGTLSIRYRSDARFAMLENFEPDRNRLFLDVLIGGASLNPSTELARSGTAAGKIELTELDSQFEVITITNYSDLGLNIWLEVDVLADVPVVWGIVGRTTAGIERFYEVGSLANSEWTKLYFNMTPEIFRSQLDSYSIGLTTFIQEEGQETGTVFLDNLKLVHF
ncbi:MAG: hypothetical protein AAFU67_02895 [Bacteroidota bacterium]